MIAIVLCGGFATRLHPLTRTCPTALLDVAGKALLDYSMPQLLDLPGLEAIHLVSNGRFVARFYEWQAPWQAAAADRGLALHLHSNGALVEAYRLGEVGDLAFALRVAGDPEGALVMSGDTIYRFPLQPIWERFRASGHQYVLAIPESHPQILQQRSVIAFDDDRVQHLYSHPDDPPTKWVCPPLYFLHRSALARVRPYLDAGGSPETLDLFIDDLAREEPVYVVKKEDRDVRLRINTRYMYDRANELLAREALMVEG